ncbi:hypothetical protein Rmet_6487 [Cupriavidus metallidurans CH34]|uniref:Uncharacterized protein n=1 Tax=Cupriavidus metallidurans (strain ATCC 43123 / DSM 2839 / NBRC 102507 / CH34) TaxID=266264 RepID=D3DXS5_CUPMC|nr:hypothetical protein Rmet_6487 [Cupriavidus metallidurans CH34]
MKLSIVDCLSFGWRDVILILSRAPARGHLFRLFSDVIELPILQQTQGSRRNAPVKGLRR